MSVWSNIGKWGARIGGYALAIPTGGASIPIGEAIAQGIGNHQAAGEANKALQQGVTQGVDTYNQAFGPYMHMGSQAANTLSGLMGFAPASTSAPGMGASAPPATTGRPYESPATGRAQPRPTVEGAPNAGIGTSLAELARPQVQSASSYQRVRMRAPDGTEEDVDPQEVSLFESKGARRV